MSEQLSEADQQTAEATAEKRADWQPLSSMQRRIVGVLVEKAKTTPDAYPMTLNALTNGCNQKSNRSPQMNVKPEQVEEVLEDLRAIGAVAEVQGGGRVAKFRHYMYEWLGVDKYELAVMTELLLRGEQTVGELRGRAARMEPIADLAALRPIVRSLIDKRLVISLTPEGRGQIVTHGLYKERELADLMTKVESYVADSSRSGETEAGESRRAVQVQPSRSSEEVALLKEQVLCLQNELSDLQQRLAKIEAVIQ